MRSLLHRLGLFVALVVLLPALTAADPKKERLIPAGELAGKLAKFDATSRHFTIQVTRPYQVGTGKSARIATKDEKIELDGVDDVQVRLAQPPKTLDDKGNRRRMTAKELQAYKVPREALYKGDLGDLKQDQHVKVQLGKSAKAAAADKAKIMTIIIQDEIVK